MTTMTEQDETRLRERLHTIGDAISTCHDEGRADLLVPRRSHRYGVTAAVAAAAVLVLVGVAVLVARGGESSTRLGDGSGVLDGLQLGPAGTFALVDTPQGMVVVVADHDRRPAVYAPMSDGRHHWITPTFDEAWTVIGVRAWLDGSSVRILADLMVDCDAPGVQALSMNGRCSPDRQQLTDYRLGSAVFEFGGLQVGTQLHFLAGGGARVIGFDLDSAVGSQTHLVSLNYSVPGSAGYPSQLSQETRACGSNGTFVYAEPVGAALRLMVNPRPSNQRSPLPPPVTRRAPLTGDPLTEGSGATMSVVGCIGAGMVVESQTSGGGTRWLSVLRADDGGYATSVQRLPAGPLESRDMHYSVDATGTAVVARQPDQDDGPGSGHDDVAVLGATGRWRMLDSTVPGDARVAVGDDSGDFVVQSDGKKGHTLERLD